MSDWLLFFIAFSCFFIAGISLISLISPSNNQSKVEKRLNQISAKLDQSKLDQLPATPSSSKSFSLINESFSQFRAVLIRRGHPFYLHIIAIHGDKQPKAIATGLLIKLIASLSLWLFIFSSFTWFQQLPCAIGMTLLLSWLYYQYLSKQQVKAYEEQLPGIIEHLARAVSTGLSVPQGLSSCAQSSQLPACYELTRLSQQISLGIPLEQALAEAQLRIPVREFNFLAVILVLNQQTGGRLSEALNNLATSLRDRKAMKLKLSSLTSEPRAAATIVSLFPPLTLLGLWLFNPRQWQFLWHDPSGQSILIYAGSSIILGLLVIHRLARGGLS